MLLSNGSDLEQTELEGSGRGLPASQQTNFQPGYLSNVEEVFTELQEKSREIKEMNVCDNLGDHLVGNVFVKFWCEEDAERAVAELRNRWLSGPAVHAELSPVSDFRESCCQQYEIGECTRGGFCNLMHLQPISWKLYGWEPRHRKPILTWLGAVHPGSLPQECCPFSLSENCPLHPAMERLTTLESWRQCTVASPHSPAPITSPCL